MIEWELPVSNGSQHEDREPLQSQHRHIQILKFKSRIDYGTMTLQGNPILNGDQQFSQGCLVENENGVDAMMGAAVQAGGIGETGTFKRGQILHHIVRWPRTRAGCHCLVTAS